MLKIKMEISIALNVIMVILGKIKSARNVIKLLTIVLYVISMELAENVQQVLSSL